MGALLAVLAEVFEISAVTGLSAEAIITGEAFTTAELLAAHIENLVTVGGLSTAEALAAAEVSTEAFEALTSLASTFPTAFKLVATVEPLAVGTLIAGAATAAALYRPAYDQALPHAGWNMALQEWFPDWRNLDLEYPGMTELARFVNYINPANWAGDVFHAVGRYIWDSLQREGQRRIGHLTNDLAMTASQRVANILARYFENARWVVTHLPARLYTHLDDYYRELPPINPPQMRDVARRVGVPPPYRYDRYAFEFTTPTPEYTASTERPPTTGRPKSGQTVETHKYQSPGGAEQRSAPDWLLPLLLGLYGDITPAWSAVIEELETEEDGPQKKKRRTTHSGAQTNSKRGNRGPRSKNRTR